MSDVLPGGYVLVERPGPRWSVEVVIENDCSTKEEAMAAITRHIERVARHSTLYQDSRRREDEAAARHSTLYQDSRRREDEAVEAASLLAKNLLQALQRIGRQLGMREECLSGPNPVDVADAITEALHIDGNRRHDLIAAKMREKDQRVRELEAEVAEKKHELGIMQLGALDHSLRDMRAAKSFLTRQPGPEQGVPTKPGYYMARWNRHGQGMALRPALLHRVATTSATEWFGEMGILRRPASEFEWGEYIEDVIAERDRLRAASPPADAGPVHEDPMIVCKLLEIGADEHGHRFVIDGASIEDVQRIAGRLYKHIGVVLDPNPEGGAR